MRGLRHSPSSTTIQGLAACCVVLACASAALAGPSKRVFNVIADYGAKGNGVADDRAAIQAALNAAEDAVARAAGATTPQGAIVYFPEGVYRVTGTLALNTSVSIEIVGAGVPAFDVRVAGQTYNYGGVPTNPLIYVNGPSTAIIADFPKTNEGPLFNFSGQLGHTMRDMVLYGCPLNSANREYCTALVRTSSDGWGNSANTYRNLDFSDALKGFVLGSGPSDGNNDLLIFERIGASKVDTVFQPQTVQSLSLHFRQISGYLCKTIFDFDNAWNGGGSISVDTLTLTDCGGTGPEDWIIKVAGQPNIGVYKFNTIFMETNSEQLLRSRGWGVTQIHNFLDARFFKNDPGRPALIRVEGGSVSVQASEFVPNTSGSSVGVCPIVEFIGNPSTNRTIRFRDCILPVLRTDNSYLPVIIKNLGSIPANSAYRIDTCDDRGNVPLQDLTSSGAW